MHTKGFYEQHLKRPLDIILSLTAIIVLAPVFLLVTILVRKKLGKPVLFTQERPGLNEKIFKMYKFRSMTNKCDINGNLLPDKERLTSFGKFLRSTSLDELPELFNILKGEMSLIGPRPLSVKYLPYYNQEERRRHNALPGLSGWAQVNGRTSLDWEKRFKYDVEYVDNISLIFDIKIFFMTIQKVLMRSDIVEAGSQGDFSTFRQMQAENALTLKKYTNCPIER